MKRNIYVLLISDEVFTYSNLAKLIKNTPSLAYFPVYRAIKDTGIYSANNVKIVKTTLK
jgi:hypothetical protein